MYALIWFGLSRRLTVEGLDNIDHLDERSSVLISSNHRTFFDFFVVTWVNFDRTKVSLDASSFRCVQISFTTTFSVLD